MSLQTNDVKVNQVTRTDTPVAYADRFIRPFSNGLWGFDSNQQPMGVSLGAGLTMTGSTLVADSGSAASQMVISGGTNSQSTGTVNFSDSNGVSFGLNTNGVMTASHNGLTSQSVQTQNSVLVQGSSGPIIFSNSNNVSFGGNNGTITASASFNQTNDTAKAGTGFTSAGNNIGLSGTLNTNGFSLSATVAAQTVDTNKAGTGFTSAGANVSLSGTLNTNGLSLSASVAAQSTQPVAVSAANGSYVFSTLSFSNTNGISFGTSAGSAITASHNGITSQSNQAFSAGGGSSAFQTLSFANSFGVSFSNSNGSVVGSIASTYAGTGFTSGGANVGLSGTLNSNGLSLSATVAAGTNSSWTVSDAATSVTVGRLAFTQSNGLTLSLSTSNNGNHTVIGSYTVPTVTNSSMTVSDAATSGTLARLAFTNLNGVTLSLSTGAGGSHTIVGSHNGLTSQSNQAFSAQGGSSAFQTLSFANSFGVSFSNSNGSVVGSIASTYAGTGFTSGGANVGLSGTLNSNGLSLSATVAPVTNSSWTVSDNNTSATVGRLAFTQSNGLTLSLSTSNNGNHTVIGSYTVPTVTNSSWTVSDGATSATVGRLAFSNSNGLAFGLSTSNNGNHTLTGSYTVPTVTNSSMTVSDAATSGTLARLAFTNLNGVTLSLSTGAGGSHTIVGSHNGLTSQSNQAFSAGGGSSAFQTLSFGNSFGVSFSNSNGSVVGSIASTYAGTGFTSGGANVGISGTNNSNGLSLSVTVAAVTNSSWTVSDNNTSATVGRLAFTQSNGLTLSLSTSNNGNHTVIGSYTVPTVTNSSMTISDAATSGTLARLAFTNLNGVTLSLSTGAGGSHTIVGSHNGLTSQSNQAFSANGGSSAFQTLGFSDGGGVTFTNTNGSVGATVRTDYASSNHSHGNPTLALTNLSGTTASASNGFTLSLSAAPAAGTSWTVSDAATSATVGQLAFTNLNGVTLSLSTGAGGSHTIVGSHNALTSQSNQAFSANGGSSAFQTLGFSDGNGVTFTNTNGSVGASVVGPLTLSSYFTGFAQGGSSNSTALASATSSPIYVFPFSFANYVSVGNMDMIVTAGVQTITGSGSQTGGLAFGIFSRATNSNSTRIDSMVSSSFSWTVAMNNSTGSMTIRIPVATDFATGYSYNTGGSIPVTASSVFTGIRYLGLPVNSLMSPGQYWLAIMATQSTSSSSCGFSIGLQGLLIGSTVGQIAAIGLGISGAGSDPNSGPFSIGLGRWSSAGSVTNLPPSMAFASISVNTTNMVYPQMRFWRT